MEEKMQAILMLEILGKPKEHIKKTLDEIVKRLGKEKDVRIITKSIAEPKPLPNQEGVFTSFAEIEIETTLPKLMLLIFIYMPSHIDIITPENVDIKNSDLNLFFNELARKLHQYDELARALIIERQIIAKQIKEGKFVVEKKEDLEGGIRSKEGKKKKGKKK